MSTHQKHPKLQRPDYGHFHRNEWAFIGAPCGQIQQLARQLIKQLQQQYSTAYVDADHKGDDHSDKNANELIQDVSMVYTDKISYHRFDVHRQFDRYQYRYLFNDQDVVLINGNHFLGKKQIVILDPKKKESLSRKLDRLTHVDLILTTDEQTECYDFLEEIPGIANAPMIKIDQIASIANFILAKMKSSIAPLYGLVLAGGKSQRMGMDKGAIDYHGLPQREYTAKLLSQYCEKTFYSVRADQNLETADHFPEIKDSFAGLGPFGAILSAFRQYPDAAWMVVACDLPLVDELTLGQLSGSRNPSRVATAFNSPHNEFPEPLITIWEPRSYPILLQFLSQGYSCPRKALINSNVELIDARNKQALFNANDPEDKKSVEKMLTRK